MGRDYRVVLLFGDDLNDFVSARAGREARAALMEEHRANWGTRWIMLPNPTYGSWERAITFGESGLNRDETMDRKVGALDPLLGGTPLPLPLHDARGGEHNAREPCGA